MVCHKEHIQGSSTTGAVWSSGLARWRGGWDEVGLVQERNLDDVLHLFGEFFQIGARPVSTYSILKLRLADAEDVPVVHDFASSHVHADVSLTSVPFLLSGPQNPQTFLVGQFVGAEI